MKSPESHSDPGQDIQGPPQEGRSYSRCQALIADVRLLIRATQRSRKRFTKKRIFWLIILAVAISGLLFGTLSRDKIAEEAHRPLGPTLPPLATFTPSPTWPSDATATPTSVVTPRPLCGGPKQMIILAIGADTSYGYVRGLADAIRVVRVDFVIPRIDVLTIPRDLWVCIPGLGEYSNRPIAYFGVPLTADGQEMDFPENCGRINSAYFYGTLYDLPGSGPGVLAHTIYQNLGLPIDHYVAMDMVAFAKAIDMVGGIDIYLPKDVDGTSQGLPYFAAGWQHMTGETAMQYVRIRFPDNDRSRSGRQNQVLLALREKVLQPKMLSNVPPLVDTLLDDVLTDLSKAQIGSLTCIVAKVERDNITSYDFAPDLVTSTYTTHNAFVLLPDMQRVRLLISNFLNGVDPNAAP